MRLAGWFWIAILLWALEPSRAQAADPSIEEVWDRSEENALRAPRSLLFTGSLLAATSLGSAYVGRQRAREYEQCRGATECTELDDRRDRRHKVSLATGVLASAAVALLVSGGVWLAKRKHTRAPARPLDATPLVLRW